MADEYEGEEDGIEDVGAPPIMPGMRVWTDPTGEGPPTADERARFNIPDAPPPRPAGWATSRPVEEPRVEASTARDRYLAALVEKFPAFDPNWPPATQESWFASFGKMLDAGLGR